MSYDRVYNKGNLQYGLIYGDATLVFIKTGSGGDIYGYKNKYIGIATEINRIRGYSVLVSTSSVESDYSLEEDMSLVDQEIRFVFKIIYVGVSKGALIGAQQAWKYHDIKKMLLINGPLMINWHKTKAGIENLDGVEVAFAYGTKDPSYKYIEILKTIRYKMLHVIELDGADHKFNGMTDELKKMTVDYVCG